MLRSYKKKTTKGEGAAPEVVLQAARRVKLQNVSLRKEEFKLNYRISLATAKRLLTRTSCFIARYQFLSIGYQHHRQVFDDHREKPLTNHTLSASDIYFGLSPKEFRKLAYQLASKYGAIFPASWELKKRAGEDWLLGFMKRNPCLSPRKSQPTSLARASDFNEANVKAFLRQTDNDSRHAYSAGDIFNMDAPTYECIIIM